MTSDRRKAILEVTIEITPRITVDAGTRFGKPVIAGTRVPVQLVVAKLGGEMSTQDVAAEYEIAIADVLAFAAQRRG
jgi:uncharacterized protein (DUF433 family)